jgi:hypothetical protein
MDADYINNAWAEIKDKQVAMSVIRAEVLGANAEEFQALMALKEMTEAMHGYKAFAHNFVENKIRDARLQGVNLAKGIA